MTARVTMPRNICRIGVSLCLLLVATSTASLAQVEHNYRVGPQHTACDSLALDGLGLEAALERLRNTAFRYRQEFRLSRPDGLRGATYYSCDHQTGLLAVRYGSSDLLYEEVPRAVWVDWTASGDPEAFFHEKVQGRFPSRWNTLPDEGVK
jgi:hypothetical protein